MNVMAKSLVELCDPLFQYVCRLNRLARKGGIVDQGQLRAELKSLLNDTRAACEAVPGMGEQFAKVRLPLIYFVDFMVRESALPFARSWKHLQEEEAREIVGDEKFFNLLDDTMAEQGDAANQRLAVFYCCLGLGFTGIHLNEPEVLRRRMLGISGRIRGMVDAEDSSKITPEAYQSVREDVLQRPVAQGIATWVIVLVGMATLFVVGSYVGYNSAVSEIKESLGKISGDEAAAQKK